MVPNPGVIGNLSENKPLLGLFVRTVLEHLSRDQRPSLLGSLLGTPLLRMEHAALR